MKRIAPLAPGHRDDEHETRTASIEIVGRDDDDGPIAGLLVTDNGIKLRLPNLAVPKMPPRIHLRFVAQLWLWLRAVGEGRIPGRDLRTPGRIFNRIRGNCRIRLTSLPKLAGPASFLDHPIESIRERFVVLLGNLLQDTIRVGSDANRDRLSCNDVPTPISASCRPIRTDSMGTGTASPARDRGRAQPVPPERLPNPLRWTSLASGLRGCVFGRIDRQD